jgi:signal transduction histidine kinase
MINEVFGAVSLLLVEDDADCRKVVADILIKNGFNCNVAENGQEGIELYRRLKPELVLSDIMMPVMSGLDMARTIRSEFSDAQFIFMTALKDTEYLLEAIDIGVSSYVVKPVLMPKLLSAVSQRIATSRREAQARRGTHLEAIGLLAGGVAHDFNNLLQVVMGRVGLAKKYVDPDNPAFTHLELAENVSKDARRLGKRLGTLANGESGTRKKMSLIPVISYSVESALSGTTVVPSYDLPRDLPQVCFNKTQLEQVILQLALNAIDAMHLGGTLSVCARVCKLTMASCLLLPPGEYVKIAFSDTGNGIQNENLPKIFNPYFTTKEMDFHKGRGLGLSICHAIVSTHGGQISAQSTPGAGATFTIWLPCAGADCKA